MRLFIADADQELRLGLQLLLHQEPGMTVVGIAVNTTSLLAQVTAAKPDVLLLDWHLPGRPPTEVLADLNGLERRPQIIVLSVRPETEREAKAAGADGFFAKTASADRLVAILRRMRSPPAAGVAVEDG